MNGERVPVGDKLFAVKSFDPLISAECKPHTLIVGTMPSVSSHGLAAYYGHPSNVFWWIVGEALGFRRGGPNNTQPWPQQWDKKVACDIISGLNLHDAEILPYDEQVQVLLRSGFALWDVVKTCNIKNSDDTSISNYQPNDISGLVATHPTLKRIVFASGKTSATLFAKMNKDWLKSGEFLVGSTEFSQAVFNKYVATNKHHVSIANRIELIVPVSVSPAGSANLRFPEKRDHWLKHVFTSEFIKI